MSKTDFQNGFALGLASGGVVEVEVDPNAWVDDTSEVVFEKGCYQNAKISACITKNGTLTYKRNSLEYDNQYPQWSFGNSQQMYNMLGKNTTDWLSVKQAEIVNIPEATDSKLITEIGQCAFALLVNLTRVKIPDTITQIGIRAFSECYKLREINIHSVNVLGANAFSACTSLERVNGIENVISVGGYCFATCFTLKELIFGENLDSLGELCFQHCYGLKKIHFNSIPSTIHAKAFLYCSCVEDIKFIAESIKTSLNFSTAPLLSAESIQSIIDGLATVTTAQTLTLNKAIVLTDEQKATINAKGWTLAQ